MIYKYLLDGMKYLMKVDTCVVLQKDFTVEKYMGFICDTQQFSEDFRAVEIPEKDKYMQRILKTSNPVTMNEKFKETFTPFLVKNLGITGYNLMSISVHDELFGSIGCIIFANKHIEKERRMFDKRDERYAEVCANTVKAFFKIKDSEMIVKNIEDKNWKMSELVDDALASSTIKGRRTSLVFKNFKLPNSLLIKLWYRVH